MKIKKRNPAKRGLSYLDANRHRLITVESDVLGIRQEIESTWPELEVFFDEWEETWVVVEHCGDGIDRLACKSRTLDHQLLRIIQSADSHRVDFDLEKSVDDWNDRIERAKDHELYEKLGEFAERFRFALKKDGFYAHENIYGTNSSKNIDSRFIRNRRSI